MGVTADHMHMDSSPYAALTLLQTHPISKTVFLGSYQSVGPLPLLSAPYPHPASTGSSRRGRRPGFGSYLLHV